MSSMATTRIKLLDMQSNIFLVEFLAQRISLSDKINVQNSFNKNKERMVLQVLHIIVNAKLDESYAYN